MGSSAAHKGTLVAAGALLIAALPSPGRALELVAVAVPSQVTPNLTVTIAKLGVPQTVATKAGDTIRQLVLAKCGSVDPVYYSVVRSENPALPTSLEAPLSPETQVVLPACAPPPLPELRDIRRGDTLTTYLRDEVVPQQNINLATSQARRDRLLADAFAHAQASSLPLRANVLANARSAARALNEIVLGSAARSAAMPDLPVPAEPIRDPNVLIAGTTVVVPAQRTFSRTIALRPGVGTELALAALRDASNADTGGRPSLATTRPASAAAASVMLRPTSAAILPVPASGQNARCGSAPDAATWPLPFAAMAERLAENDRLRPPGLKRERNLILVLDTGFDFMGSEPGFPGGAFPAVRSMMSRVAYGGVVEPFFTQRGVNLATMSTGAATNAPYVIGSNDFRWHGAGVTSAALGTRLLDGRRVSPYTGEIATASTIQDDGDHPPYSSPTALAEGLRYADSIGARVVNYSFELSTDPRIDDELEKYGSRAMLVAAAGNSGASAIDAWPARLGGERGNARGVVVTVGGHEPSGDLWPSTNRHPQRVDLLAPACDIPAYEGEIVGTEKRARPGSFAGTSFATPIVSFVAGLLIGEGLPPADVKTRLSISATVDGKTIKASYSGGRLNAPVALSLYSDVLTLSRTGSTPETVYGRFEDDAVPVTICGKAMNLSKLHKLALYPDGATRKARYWWAESPDALGRGDTSDCPASDIDFMLKFKTTGGALVDVRSSEVVDYTRRYFQVY